MTNHFSCFLGLYLFSAPGFSQRGTPYNLPLYRRSLRMQLCCVSPLDCLNSSSLYCVHSVPVVARIWKLPRDVYDLRDANNRSASSLSSRGCVRVMAGAAARRALCSTWREPNSLLRLSQELPAEDAVGGSVLSNTRAVCSKGTSGSLLVWAAAMRTKRRRY